MSKKEQEQEEYSSMVNANSMLLGFEGWIKYIEGFTKCLSSTKTVDSNVMMDCVGEILEYMNTLRQSLYKLLVHCETILEEQETLQKENQELKQKLQILESIKIEENKDGQKM